MSEIQVERSERGVATVWLDNPRHLNALTDAMIIGLCEELPRLADDTTCRAIVLRGRGGVFCAGRELRDVKALQGAGLDDVASDVRLHAEDERGDLLFTASGHQRHREIRVRHRHDARQLERYRAGRGRRDARAIPKSITGSRLTARCRRC